MKLARLSRPARVRFRLSEQLLELATGPCY